MDNEVRLRIAPSPTGEPHVGTAYIALFNRTYAKSKKGKFILRIEDTDRERSTSGSEKAIIDSLKWLGLDWDEGPDIGGEFAPYRQSERIDIYKCHADILIEKGFAYRCFCSKEDLDAMRLKQSELKLKTQGYFASYSPCRALSKDESKRRAENGEPFVVRLKVPDENPEEEICFFDKTRGKDISLKYCEIDDQVLLKTDGFPTYHLANVVDDHLMKVSVVMRGEEWIPSTFKHVLLYKAFGWDMPDFYHLSLLRNCDKNKSKISKRKNPVSLRWFRAAGYTPCALLNFLALMGYSREQEGLSQEELKLIEIFSVNDLVKEFDPKRISTTGPAFDYNKLNSINQEYINRMSIPEFSDYLCERTAYMIEFLSDLMPHVKERFARLEREVGFWTDFLFKLSIDYRKTDFEKTGLSFKDISNMLSQVKKSIKNKTDIIKDINDFRESVAEIIKEFNIDSKKLHMVLRIVMMGESESLPLYEAMSSLGIYRCLNRIDDAISFLNAIR